MFARLVIILYLFAFIVVIMAIAVHEQLGVNIFIKQNGNATWTGSAIEGLITSQTPSVSKDPTLLFGDFFTASSNIITLLFQGVTGGIVADVFSGLPFSNFYAMLLIRFLYTFSGAFLGYQILTGRTV